MNVQGLDGNRVLLILIPEHDPATTHFVLGEARWTGRQLLVDYSDRHPPIPVREVAVERDGFDPAVFPELLAPGSDAEALADLADDVDWCVPAFVASVPPGTRAVRMPFEGLAAGPDGEILLLRDLGPEADDSF